MGSWAHGFMGSWVQGVQGFKGSGLGACLVYNLRCSGLVEVGFRVGDSWVVWALMPLDAQIEAPRAAGRDIC